MTGTDSLFLRFFLLCFTKIVLQEIMLGSALHLVHADIQRAKWFRRRMGFVFHRLSKTSHFFSSLSSDNKSEQTDTMPGKLVSLWKGRNTFHLRFKVTLQTFGFGFFSHYGLAITDSQYPWRIPLHFLGFQPLHPIYSKFICLCDIEQHKITSRCREL